MLPSKHAMRTLLGMCNDYGGLVLEDYGGIGVCFTCGDTRDGVEPDAIEYYCDACGEDAVHGIEISIQYL